MNLKNYFLMSLPILSASLMAGDIYVDSSFDGTSTGAKDAPYTTIQAAANAAQQGDTIWLYGSDTVSYVMEDDSAAVVIDLDNITIRGYTDNGEASDWFETNKMTKVYIPDGYASRSFEIDGNTQTPFILNGANTKIQGIFFDFGGKSFRQQNKGGNNMIVVTNSNFVCENSFFYSSSETGYEGALVPISAKNIKTPVMHNMVFNRCGFKSVHSYRNNCAVFGHCQGVLTVKKCYFERIFKLANGGSDNIRNTTLNVVSNIFYNCYSSHENGSYEEALFGRGGNYFPKNGKISYNRIIRDDFDSKYGKYRYNAVSHGGMYGGCFDKEFEFHHNTIVGLDVAFISMRRNQGNDSADLWTPAIHNNLFVLNDGGVFIEEREGTPDKNGWGGPGMMFSGDRTTSFLPGSYIRNNAILCDTFVGGDATTNSWYKFEYEEGANSGAVLTDNINLEEATTFVNTTDPTHEDFYRLRLEDYAWVRKNAWTGENGEYPRYIGALDPLLPTGFLIVIK